jgi:hypothetical protein
MADGFRRFRGPRLLVLCGADLTAREFEDAAAGPAWKGLLAATGVTILRLPDADHTFSRAAWRDQVAAGTLDWLRGLGPIDIQDSQNPECVIHGVPGFSTWEPGDGETVRTFGCAVGPD